MRFVIVTGMSGAGKSSVLKMLEDVGYFCMDNLPVSLVPKLTELLSMPNSSIDKVALGMDIRSRYGAGDLGEALDQLDERNVAYEVLFLDAKDNVLIKRYKETRRRHPLSEPDAWTRGLPKNDGYLCHCGIGRIIFWIPADC